MIYEAVLLAALLVAATALFVAVAGDSTATVMRTALRMYLVLIAGIYLVWSWTGGRRTLAMQTWRIRLVDREGKIPDLRTATVRYVVALLGIAAFALGLFWAVLDRERQFLHDRIAGTRLIRE